MRASELEARENSFSGPDSGPGQDHPHKVSVKRVPFIDSKWLEMYFLIHSVWRRHEREGG